MGIPQHFLQDDVKGTERMGASAREREVDIALHTHVNRAQQVTPLVGAAVRLVLDFGFRDIRNQGVLLRGEHLAGRPAGPLLHAPRPRQGDALLLLHVRHDPQRRALAYVGVGRPRTCRSPSWGTCRGSPRRGSCATSRSSASDGSTWSTSYDRERGISRWTKNYRTGIEFDDPDALSREYAYYDPIYALPGSGQQWWREQIAAGLPDAHWVEPPAPIEPAADSLATSSDGETASVRRAGLDARRRC